MLLVTGITGHSGRYFLQELIQNKYDTPIRCVVRETSNTSLLDQSGLNIEKVIGTIDDPTFINEAMNGIDTVLHIYNIHHSPLIVQSAINHKVERVILVHTTGIYSKFKNASQEYKNIEQQILELTTLAHCETSITILRPTMIYGDLCDHNMSKFIKMLDILRIVPVINHGNSLIQPVNARDLGKAYYQVLMSPNETEGKIYDLSGEKPIKLIDVFRIVNKELNRKSIFINIPMGVGVLMAKALKLFTLGKYDYIEKIQRMGEDRSYPHDKATRDFEYTPMLFTDGISKEIQEYLKHKRR